MTDRCSAKEHRLGVERFRRYRDQCLRWAERVVDATARDRLIQMADDCEQAAQHLDASGERIRTSRNLVDASTESLRVSRELIRFTQILVGTPAQDAAIRPERKFGEKPAADLTDGTDMGSPPGRNSAA